MKRMQKKLREAELRQLRGELDVDDQAEEKKKDKTPLRFKKILKYRLKKLTHENHGRLLKITPFSSHFENCRALLFCIT